MHGWKVLEVVLDHVLVILERVVMQEMHFLLLHHLNVDGFSRVLYCYTMQLNCSYLGSV